MNRVIYLLAVTALITGCTSPSARRAYPLPDWGRVRQSLVAPPRLPEYTQVVLGAPKIVKVEGQCLNPT